MGAIEVRSQKRKRKTRRVENTRTMRMRKAKKTRKAKNMQSTKTTTRCLVDLSRDNLPRNCWTRRFVHSLHCPIPSAHLTQKASLDNQVWKAILVRCHLPLGKIARKRR